MKDILQVVGMGVAVLYIVGVLGAFAWMRHVRRTYLGLGRAARRVDRFGHEHTEWCLDQYGRDCPDRLIPS